MRPKQFSLVAATRKTVPVDTHIAPAEHAIQIIKGGTGDATIVVSYTQDNPLTTAEASLNLQTLYTAAATTVSTVMFPIAGLSFLFTSVSGTNTATVNYLQSGPNHNA